jgi:hypothetical protein
MGAKSMITAARLSSAIVALGLCLASASSAREPGAFARLAGNWNGGGSIDLSNGSRERLKCRASYQILSAQSVQLSIRCASDSYNFDLAGRATLAGREVSGTWSESTHNASGQIFGRANGDKIDVVAEGPGFSAQLTLVTRGRRQSVAIKSKDPQSTLQAVTINLTRR